MRKESKKIVRNNLEEEEFCEIERKEKKRISLKEYRKRIKRRIETKKNCEII